MQGRFGVREICDVTFKALSTMKVGNTTFKAGQPVFSIETAQTSNMEQATTTVYAQGGKGYNRLIAWEGEKTLTFTVTDALMSPMGMKVLTGAGLIDAEADNKMAHFHMAMNVQFNGDEGGKITLDQLNEELGTTLDEIKVCVDVPAYGSVLNGGGSVVDWLTNTVTMPTGTDGLFTVTKEAPLTLTLDDTGANSDKKTFGDKAIKVDFYVAMASGVQTIQIEPSSFGGFFYVEADTLFRDETTGKDLAASLVFPKVKIQSAFTFTMAASGDPSTFDFVMDVMPGYTRFDKTKKTLVDMQIITGGSKEEEEIDHPNHNSNHASKN